MVVVTVLQVSIFNSQTVKTLAGADAPGFLDSLSLEARFKSPTGLTADNSGNILVADKKNNRIRKINALGKVTTIAGNEQGNKYGKALFAKFNAPSGIVIDSKGNIYISDTNNNAVKVLRTSGIVELFAGSDRGEPGNVNGKLKEARFSSPEGLAIDSKDNLYIADKLNHNIRKISTNGQVITLAGRLMGNEDGLKSNAKFYNPVAVAVDTNGNVFVADAGNNKIRKISTDGLVSTLAGKALGYEDGPGYISKFNTPTGLAIDKSNNLYVSDYGNNTIRKITPYGFVSTVAGSLQAGSKDGYAKNASFMNPAGLAVNEKGDVIIADTQNHKIRKLITNNNSPADRTGLAPNVNKENLSAN